MSTEFQIPTLRECESVTFTWSTFGTPPYKSWVWTGSGGLATKLKEFDSTSASNIGWSVDIVRGTQVRFTVQDADGQAKNSQTTVIQPGGAGTESGTCPGGFPIRNANSSGQSGGGEGTQAPSTTTTASSTPSSATSTTTQIRTSESPTPTLSAIQTSTPGQAGTSSNKASETLLSTSHTSTSPISTAVISTFSGAIPIVQQSSTTHIPTASSSTGNLSTQIYSASSVDLSIPGGSEQGQNASNDRASNKLPGIIGGAFAGAVVLAILLAYLCRRKKRRRSRTEDEWMTFNDSASTTSGANPSGTELPAARTSSFGEKSSTNLLDSPYDLKPQPILDPVLLGRAGHLVSHPKRQTGSSWRSSLTNLFNSPSPSASTSSPRFTGNFKRDKRPLYTKGSITPPSQRVLVIQGTQHHGYDYSLNLKGTDDNGSETLDNLSMSRIETFRTDKTQSGSSRTGLSGQSTTSAAQASSILIPTSINVDLGLIPPLSAFLPPSLASDYTSTPAPSSSIDLASMSASFSDSSPPIRRRSLIGTSSLKRLSSGTVKTQRSRRSVGTFGKPDEPVPTSPLPPSPSQQQSLGSNAPYSTSAYPADPDFTSSDLVYPQPGNFADHTVMTREGPTTISAAMIARKSPQQPHPRPEAAENHQRSDSLEEHEARSVISRASVMKLERPRTLILSNSNGSSMSLDTLSPPLTTRSRGTWSGWRGSIQGRGGEGDSSKGQAV